MTAMDKTQFRSLIASIILSAVILSIGIALQNGVWENTKFIWDDDELVVFTHNRFTDETTVKPFNFNIRDFVKIKRLSRNEAIDRRKAIEKEIAIEKILENTNRKQRSFFDLMSKKNVDKLQKEIRDIDKYILK